MKRYAKHEDPITMHTPLRKIGGLVVLSILINSGLGAKENDSDTKANRIIKAIRLIPAVNVSQQDRRSSEKWRIRLGGSAADQSWSRDFPRGPLAPVLAIPKKIGSKRVSVSKSMRKGNVSIKVGHSQLDISSMCGYGCAVIEMPDAWYLLFVEAGLVTGEDGSDPVAWVNTFWRNRKESSFELVSGKRTYLDEEAPHKGHDTIRPVVVSDVPLCLKLAAGLFRLQLQEGEAKAYNAVTNPEEKLTYRGSVCGLLKVLNLPLATNGNGVDGFPIYRNGNRFLTIIFGRIPATGQHFDQNDCEVICTITQYSLPVIRPLWVYWDGENAFTGFSEGCDYWITPVMLNGHHFPALEQ